MANARPALVTVPMPGPAKNRMPVVFDNCTVARMTAPCVTSGSSPASLMVLAVALFWESRWQLSMVNLTGCPRGRVMNVSGAFLSVSNNVAAAKLVAVAHAPVV